VPVLKDLARDGDTVRRLRDATTKALATATASATNRFHLVAHRVFFGEQESVVCMDQFCDDPEPEYLAARDHRSVCKPSRVTDEPCTKLLEALR
jgi:hypothetical protein